MSDVTDSALALARSGYAVFPCNGDKTPRVPGGFKSATTDATAILEWGGLWDGALIGAAVPYGTFVLDIDPRNGGDTTMKVFDSRPFPKTRLVRTRSGGLHLHYAVPDDAALRASLGPGVDIKQAGKGYVIVPPSPGYVLEVDADPAPAPDWLLEELALDKRLSPEASGDRYFAAFDDGSPYGLRAMEGEVGRLVQTREGGRNHALNTAAFALAQLAAGGELSEVRAKDELAAAALLIGLEASETRATIESGWEAGSAEPRRSPPQVEGETPPTNPTLVDDAEADTRYWVDWAVDEEPPPFYVWPLLPKNAYVLVFGSSEASKSMVCMALLADGSHRGVRSSIYSFENTPAVDRDRCRRWGPDPANFRITNQPLDFNDPRQVEALVKREKNWSADVVLFDTYSHAYHSKSDDGNQKAIEFARRVRYVMHEVGCSVIVLDHTGFDGDEPRDASAKRQQVDVAILMRKLGTWTLGEPSRFSMENRKAARFANPFFMQGAIRDVKRDEVKGLVLDWSGEKPRWDV